MAHKRIFFQLSVHPVACGTPSRITMSQTLAPLTLAQWVATHLEFTPHDTHFVWSKSLLERIRKEVRHVGPNEISAFLKQQGACPGTKHCKAAGKSETCIFKVQYRTASLEPLNAQSALEEVADAAPTLSQWFSAVIEVTGDNRSNAHHEKSVCVSPYHAVCFGARVCTRKAYS